MSAMYCLAKERAATLARTSRSLCIRSRSCAIRRCFSSKRRFSSASSRCTSASSALRLRRNSRLCRRMLSSSSSSSTSSMLCSNVLPTSTSRMGCTSRSKSNRSPSSIWVATSMPILAGMKSGDGGRSMNGSVCVTASTSGGLSVSSSRYVSVCTTMWRRPSTGSGVRDRPPSASSSCCTATAAAVAWYSAAAARCAWRRSASTCAFAGTT
mmetsp:Transcript_23168/g.74546  ORF Transcript_23168/g.74546 Transcript_23168/m.74546 type:complete len:211 (-) Transcript_23168:159-791(-)